MARSTNTRRNSPDLILFMCTLVLLTLGVLMVFSASSVTAYSDFGDAYYYLKRQAMWAVLGITAMVTLMNIDYRLWKKLAYPIFTVVLIMLAVVWIPGVGNEVGGARRWLGVGVAQVQPSELAKLALIFLIAKLQTGHLERTNKFKYGILYPLIPTIVVFGLIMLEPDLGTCLAIFTTAVLMILAAGCNIFHILGLGGLAVPAVVGMIFAEPYRLKRLMSFTNPWKDPLGDGFHAVQSLMALGSGGLFGVGLGRSRQKFHYLPEQHTDFIFAILGEELGLIGATMVLGLFFTFAWRGFRTAISCEDPFGALLAVGITTQVLAQVIINIGVVSGALPVTGITLPLISSGGSSLCITLAGIGILLNISKQVSR